MLKTRQNCSFLRFREHLFMIKAPHKFYKKNRNKYRHTNLKYKI